MYELYAAIHQRWERTATLRALLPGWRVITGDGSFRPPCAVVVPGRELTSFRTTTGYLHRVEFDICLRALQFSQLEAIARQVQSAYEGWVHPLSAGKLLVGMWFDQATPVVAIRDYWEKSLRFVAVIFIPLATSET